MNQSGAAQREHGASDCWLTPRRFALLLGVLIFATFPQVLLGLQTFVVRDFGFFAYPLAYYQRECFWRGEFPLWNPYNNCGVPFLAQWNTMALYPPALIYLLLPLSWSLSFFCLVHQFWAGLGMYFLVRRWTGSSLGAAVGGVMFAFNGLTLNLLMWPSHIATLSWMPWVVGAVERGWREGGRRLILGSLVGALQMLAGGPETILFTWLILLGLWATDVAKGGGAAVSEQRAQRMAMLRRFPLVIVLVGGLAAAQLLPFLDLASHSQRQEGYADSRWSMPGYGWVNFLVPMAFGRIWPMGVFFQYFQSWTSSYYLGIGGLLLAMVGIYVLREKRTWVLMFMACAGLIMAFGDQTLVFRWLGFLVPQLSLITNPVKFVLPAVFAAAVLAGWTVARLRLRASEPDRPYVQRKLQSLPQCLLGLAGVLIVLIGLILIVARQFPFPEDNYSATLHNGLSRVAFLVGFVAVLLLLHRDNLTPRRQTLMAGALLVVFWLDFMTHEPTQNPTVPRSVYAPELAKNKVNTIAQPALGQSRVMITPAADSAFTQTVLRDPSEDFLSKRFGSFANCNLLDGVPKVNGFFSLYPRECGELNSILYGSTHASFPHVEDFLSVSRVYALGSTNGWLSRDSWMPLATAGQKPLFYGGTNEWYALTAMNFDPRTMVILPRELKGSVTVTNQTTASAVITNFTMKRVDLFVEAADAALVVVSQTYYHPWRAFLDGVPTRLLRANYAFQAVEVPRGQHHIELVYQDRAFGWGLAITGLSFLGCLLGVWGTRSNSCSHSA